MPLNMTFLRKLPGNKDFSWYAATLCGLGFFTAMPGTVGSVVAFCIFILHPLPLGAILGVCLLGVWVSDRYSKNEGVTDPGEIIIDEVAGTWIAMYGLPSAGAFPLPDF
jgi:phosphatidylglycerophosphatase A